MAERAVRAVVIGANGRMGRAIAAAAAKSGELEIVSGISTPGQDLERALSAGEVVLDFSRGDAAEAHIAACRRARRPLLLGTTGHPPTLERVLAEAGRDIALLVAPNTSVGIAVLLELASRAARTLPPEFDAEVFEAHHRDKRDAPSGTALAIGESIAAARGSRLSDRRAPPREGARVRQPLEIGFAVVRGGDIVGEHEARFAGEGEQLTIGHQVTDRAVFARGAVRGAVWLARQAPGLYRMADVLALRTGA
jgi:4-hydroxy-tetrahydrodipicolinate reductase